MAMVSCMDGHAHAHAHAECGMGIFPEGKLRKNCVAGFQASYCTCCHSTARSCRQVVGQVRDGDLKCQKLRLRA
jgi:hypothetical protein